MFAGVDDVLKVGPIIFEIVQSRFRGHLRQAIHIVTIANFVESSDQWFRTGEIADALETERVSFGECSGHDDVFKLVDQLEGIFLGEIDVGLIQDDNPFKFATKLAEGMRAIGPAARGVGCGDKCQGCFGIPVTL